MHERIDERSREMHVLIECRLRRNPSLLRHARANLDRWRRTCSARVARTFDEWEGLLDGDIETLLNLLVSRDERAVRLRQSSPFVGAHFLSKQERDEIFRRFREPVTD